MISNIKDYTRHYEELWKIGKGNYGKLIRGSFSNKTQAKLRAFCSQENWSFLNEKRRLDSGSIRGLSYANPWSSTHCPSSL